MKILLKSYFFSEVKEIFTECFVDCEDLGGDGSGGDYAVDGSRRYYEGRFWEEVRHLGNGVYDFGDGDREGALDAVQILE